MKLFIHDHTTIADIQQQFNAVFPYLKLGFFSKLHKEGKGTRLKFLLPENLQLGEIRKSPGTGVIEITANMKVSELEQLFGNEYGIGVQVFRQSGNSWLETIRTDDWTLKQQNDEGAFLSTRIRPEIPDPDEDID